MLSLKTIRRRIQAVKNMQKVTKAMKLVAAAKLKKAQRDALAARYYTDNLRDVIVGVSRKAGFKAPPLMRRRKIVSNVDILTITSERGLCGTFNENLLRSIFEKIKDHLSSDIKVNLFMYGKKGYQYCRGKNISLIKTEEMEGENIEDQSKRLALLFTDRFLKNESDGAYLAFNRFVTTARQEISFWDFLPLHWRGTGPERYQDYIYEPSRQEVVEDLAREMLSRSIFQAFLESNAAELAARMIAMDKATKNANDMISHLTLQYHKARQAAITSELLDIVGGAEALA